MNKMKQTAVEWLINQMKQRESQGLTLSMYELEMFGKRAEEMFQEQMSNAMLHGWRKALDEEVHSIDPNDFYNKTFKSE